MPQPFPDPFSALSKGLMSGINIAGTIANIRAAKEKAEADKEERERKARAEQADLIVKAAKLVNQGLTSLAEKVLVLGGVDKKEVASTIKQMQQADKALEGDLAKIREDDPMAAEFLRRTILASPKDAARIYLDYKKHKEQKTLGEFIQQELGSGPQGAQAVLGVSGPAGAPPAGFPGSREAILPAGAPAGTAPVVPAIGPTGPAAGASKMDRLEALATGLRTMNTEKSKEAADSIEKLIERARKGAQDVRAEERLGMERERLGISRGAEERAKRGETRAEADLRIRQERLGISRGAEERAKTRETTEDIERRARAQAKGREKTLKQIRDEEFTRVKARIDARVGLPQSQLGRLLIDLEKAKKSDNPKAVELHEKAIEKMTQSQDFKNKLVRAITAARAGNFEEVPENLRGFSLPELLAMNIDPIRALLGFTQSTPEAAKQTGSTIQGLLENKNELAIPKLIENMPKATDAQLRGTLTNKRFKSFTEEQKKRVEKVILDELRRRKTLKKQRSEAPPVKLTPEQSKRREIFQGLGVR